MVFLIKILNFLLEASTIERKRIRKAPNLSPISGSKFKFPLKNKKTKKEKSSNIIKEPKSPLLKSTTSKRLTTKKCRTLLVSPLVTTPSTSPQRNMEMRKRRIIKVSKTC